MRSGFWREPAARAFSRLGFVPTAVQWLPQATLAAVVVKRQIYPLEAVPGASLDKSVELDVLASLP